MPISIVCPQGHQLTAKEKLAGKKVKCPKCGSVVQIPAAEPTTIAEPLMPDNAPAEPALDTLGPLVS